MNMLTCDLCLSICNIIMLTCNIAAARRCGLEVGCSNPSRVDRPKPLKKAMTTPLPYPVGVSIKGP